MNEVGLSIQYFNVAPEAKINFYAYSEDGKDLSNLDLFQRYNVVFPNYANPCEEYQTILNGKQEPIPKDDEPNIGFLSKEISDESGLFEKPIEIEFVSNALFSSQGITVEFDSYNNVYAEKMLVCWYRDDALISEMEFNPDSSVFICKNQVEYYNKILLKFYKINMPKNRLRFSGIEYGFFVDFDNKEIKNIKLIQEIDPISSKAPIGVCDFNLRTKNDIEFMFQERQPIHIKFNGDLLARVFVNKSKRNNDIEWHVEAEDYIGIMQRSDFKGGVYFNKNAYDLAVEIFDAAKVPYEIDVGLKSVYLSGYIPFTNCRSAIVQVLFATQFSIDTSKSERVRVYKYLADKIEEIPLKRLMQRSGSYEEDAINGVEILSHSYSVGDEKELMEIYSPEENEIGREVFIKFQQPLSSVSIKNGRILEKGDNYARIVPMKNGCVLSGVPYKHTIARHRKIEDLLLYGERESVVSIENATLVSPSTVDNIINICYNYVVKNRVYKLDIIESKNDGSLGFDNLIKIKGSTQNAKRLNELNGRIIKQDYLLSGSVLVKKCEVYSIKE